MKSRTLHVVGILVAIAFLSVAFNTNVALAKSMTLKVSHQFAAGDVRDEMARVFGDMVTKKTNGEIKFRYYPAKSLFKPKAQWDAMRKGALDMAVFPLDYASGKVPQLSITLMPCSVANINQGLTWRNKPIGKKVETLMESNGVKNLVWAWFDGGIASKVKPIKVPADVNGTKLRAAGKKYELRDVHFKRTGIDAAHAHAAIPLPVAGLDFLFHAQSGHAQELSGVHAVKAACRAP